MAYDLSIAQLRYTKAQFQATNPVPAAGALCVETDSDIYATGDGSSRYLSLRGNTALSGSERQSADDVYAAMSVSDGRDDSGGGAVTSDDVTDESTLDAGTVTDALDALAQNVSDQGTAITGLTQDVAGFSGTKRYKVILTQKDTDAPAITVQRNSLGGVPVSSYVDVGQYRITLSGAFPVAKTTAILQNNSDDGAAGSVYSAKVHSSGNYVSIATGSGEDYLDDILNNTCLLIEVEP